MPAGLYMTERKIDRWIYKDRQIDRYTDRRTDRNIGRQIHSDGMPAGLLMTERKKNRQRDRQGSTDRLTDGNIGRQIDSDGMPAGLYMTEGEKDRRLNRQVKTRIDGQTKMLRDRNGWYNVQPMYMTGRKIVRQIDRDTQTDRSPKKY